MQQKVGVGVSNMSHGISEAERRWMILCRETDNVYKEVIQVEDYYYDKVMFSIGGNDMYQLLRLKFVSE